MLLNPPDEISDATRRERVAVARDAIAQIKAENYVPESGIYLRGPGKIPMRGNKNEQLRSVLRGRKCTICAKGAIFLSRVRLKDRLKLGELAGELDNEVMNGEDVFGLSGHSLSEYVCGVTGPRRALFSKREFDEIEWAFENKWKPGFISGCNCQSCREGVKVPRSFSQDDVRLVAILECIIRHRGVFDMSDAREPKRYVQFVRRMRTRAKRQNRAAS